MMAAGPSKAKVLLVGPAKCGKSLLAGFLAEVTDKLEPSDGYVPTAGCRILELERDVRGRGRIPAELWDVSGSPSCVPSRVHACVMV